MNSHGIIYKFVFSNNKIYIGQTTLALSKRIYHHEFNSRKDNPKLAVHRAWKKHGRPEITVLAIVELSEVSATEIRAIRVYDSYGLHGYNLTIGGEASPMLNPDTVAKVRALANTPERILKNKELHCGRKRSPETCENISIANKGRFLGIPKTKEHRAKIGNAHRGVPTGMVMSESHRAAIILANSKPKSEETKLKMSLAAKGKKKSDAVKANMAIAAKKREAKKREAYVCV